MLQCNETDGGHRQGPTIPTWLHLDVHLGQTKKRYHAARHNHYTNHVFSPNDKSNCGAQRHYSASNLFNLTDDLYVDNNVQTLSKNIFKERSASTTE
jgi:hypothetical protein